jgi:hypothetical protein
LRAWHGYPDPNHSNQSNSMNTPAYYAETGKTLSDWINQTGKKQMHELIVHCGLKPRFVRDAMCVAAKAGLITRVRIHGQVITWCTHAEAVRLKAEIREKHLTDDRNRARRERMKKLRAAEREIERLRDESGDWPIERSVIPAAGAPIPQTRAANSVWAWRPAA